MKHFFSGSLLLLALLFLAGTCCAQSTGSTDKSIQTTSAVASVPGNARAAKSARTAQPAAVNTETTNAAEDDADNPPIFSLQPNPTTGMLTVKAECPGKLYFSNMRGKEKGGCIISQGDNPIFLGSMLYPGAYMARYEGANGTTKTIKVIYKP